MKEGLWAAVKAMIYGKPIETGICLSFQIALELRISSGQKTDNDRFCGHGRNRRRERRTKLERSLRSGTFFTSPIDFAQLLERRGASLHPQKVK